MGQRYKTLAMVPKEVMLCHHGMAFPESRMERFADLQMDLLSVNPIKVRGARAELNMMQTYYGEKMLDAMQDLLASRAAA